MAVDHSNLLTAIYSRLIGDSTLNTALGGDASTAGRVWYGHAQQNEVMPYLTVSLVDSTPMHGGGPAGTGKDGYRARVQFTAYSADELGPSQVADVIDKLGARLSRQVLTVTGMENMACTVDTIRGPMKDEDAWRMDADYVFMGFES